MSSLLTTINYVKIQHRSVTVCFTRLGYSGTDIAACLSSLLLVLMSPNKGFLQNVCHKLQKLSDIFQQSLVLSSTELAKQMVI